MRTCHEIAHILASDPPLSPMARMELKMHLLMCRHCSAYAKQLRALGDAAKRLVGDKTAQPGLTSLEQKIIREQSKDS